MINKINKKVLYREILDYVMIAVGMLSYAIGWMVFLLPNHIGNGGVAGLASILNWGQGIPVANTYFILNAILLAIALKVLGLKFCIRTIYGVVMLTVITKVMGTVFPHPGLLHGQPFMAAIIGASFCGVGLAFGLSYNGSSGGSDIVAAIVNKYRDISLGRVILLVDMTIVTGSYLVLRSWEQVIYGYVNLIIGASTSLYGLFAAIIVLRYATRNPYIQQLGQSYLTLFVINIIGSVLIPGISLAGHIGGAVGGAFLAIIFPVKWEKRMYSTSQRIGATVLFIALAVFLCYKGMSYV